MSPASLQDANVISIPNQASDLGEILQALQAWGRPDHLTLLDGDFPGKTPF